MEWVGHKKAHNMVPHSWIIVCVKLVNVTENIIKFIQWSMSTWKTEITVCGQTLAEIEIEQGVFYGESLSPLIFVICIIALPSMLRKMKAGYNIGNVKTNNSSFKDKLYCF